MRSQNLSTAARFGRYSNRPTRQLGARGHGRIALASTRSAYRRLSEAKSPDEALNDKKLRRDLRRASTAIQAAAVALSAPPRMRTRDAVAFGALLSALLIGVVLLFVRSEKVRSKVLGKRPGEAESAEQSPSSAPDAPPDAAATA